MNYKKAITDFPYLHPVFKQWVQEYYLVPADETFDWKRTKEYKRDAKMFATKEEAQKWADKQSDKNS